MNNQNFYWCFLFIYIYIYILKNCNYTAVYRFLLEKSSLRRSPNRWDHSDLSNVHQRDYSQRFLAGSLITCGDILIYCASLIRLHDNLVPRLFLLPFLWSSKRSTNICPAEVCDKRHIKTQFTLKIRYAVFPKKGVASGPGIPSFLNRVNGAVE